MLGRQASWDVPSRPVRRLTAKLTTEDDDDDLNGIQSTQGALNFWLSQANELEPGRRDLFLRVDRSDSYEDYISELKSAVQKTVDSSRVARLSKKMKPIYLLANSIAPITASASQINPMPASLVFGGITCILSFTARVNDYQSKLIEMLEWMGDEIDIINQYRQDKVFGEDHVIKACEINIAADILQFCVKVAKMFYDERGRERNGIVFALKTQYRDFDGKFGDIKTQFELHLAALEKRRNLVNFRRMKSVNEGVNYMTEREEVQRIRDSAKSAEEQRQIFLKWLPSIDFTGMQEDNLERRVSGSGDWLMKHPSFNAWRDDTTSSRLWIYGKHGSGKSHLAARVIDELGSLTSKTPESAVAYLYCNSTPSSDTTAHFNSLLGSLLFQLCSRLRPEEDVISLIRREGGYSDKNSPSRNEIKSAIAKVVSKFSPCFIVIDGLDECSYWEKHNFRDFCAFISSLAALESGTAKVLVLSRPNYSEIEKTLAEFSTIQVDDGANEDDIQAYISEMADEIYPSESEEDSEELGEVKRLLLGRSGGMFLWVHLKINDLKDIGSMQDIKEALEDSSDNLDDLYRQKLQRIVTQSSRFVRERALKTLLWVTNSRQPLSKAEVIEALSLKSGQTGINASQRLRSNISICTECVDLVVETDGLYHLLHSSVRDFLLKGDTVPELQELQNKANSIIAEACLTYINFDVFGAVKIDTFGQREQLQTEYPLLDYASTHWASHLSLAETNEVAGPELHALHTRFLSSDTTVSTMLRVLDPFGVRGQNTPSYAIPSKETALHVLAALNAMDLAGVVDDADSMLNQNDWSGGLPIDYAVKRGHQEATVWLLKAYKRHPNTQELVLSLKRHAICDLLHEAAGHDWPDAVGLLLSLGYDIESQFYGMTPLHVACQKGAPNSVEILLASGANTGAISDSKGTPLMEAAIEGHEEVVMKLLTAMSTKGSATSERLPVPPHGGANAADDKDQQNPNSINYNSGSNALIFASSNGHTRVVELLLDNGADIMSLDYLQENALHQAAIRSEAVVKVLLQRCKKATFINAVGKKGDTPLGIALSLGKSESARLLLQHGAEPGPQSLKTAIFTGCFEIAELLISSHKMSLIEPGNFGSTPLRMAAYKGWSRILELCPDDSMLNVRDACEGTLLHIAALRNQCHFIKELRKKVPGLDLFPRNNEANTPLHYAASTGAHESVMLLLEVNPLGLLAKDKFLMLPVHSAARTGNLACVQALLTLETLDAGDCTGVTPLLMACIRGDLSMVKYMLEKGADINKSNNDGISPVGTSIRNRHPEVAQYLLDCEADCSVTSTNGEGLLHYAALIGHVELIERLLDSGCDPLSQEKDGKTPLMLAIKSQNDDAVRLLIMRDPEAIAIKDDSGRTCIHYAASLETTEILGLLLSWAPQFIAAVDEQGLDAAQVAVDSGRLSVVSLLCTMGYCVSESPRDSIEMVSEHGRVDLIKGLIDHGVDIATKEVPLSATDRGNSLTIAARRGLIETARLLLNNGASPTVKDCFGLSAIDYATRQPSLRIMLGPWQNDYGPIDRRSQLEALRELIVKRSRTCLETGAEVSETDLYTLLKALLHFRTNTSFEHLKILMTQVGCALKSRGPNICNFCRQELIGCVWFLCREGCERGSLCPPCHDSYRSSAQTGVLPLHAVMLERLERGLLPFLKVMGTVGYDGLHMLRNCIVNRPLFSWWVTFNQAAYDTCTQVNNSATKFEQKRFPGWNILDALEDLYKNGTYQGPGETESRNRQRDLFKASLDINPQREIPQLSCVGHEYIKIHSPASLPVEHKKYFDPEGRLLGDFYEHLHLHYSNLDVDKVDDFVASREPIPDARVSESEYQDRIGSLLESGANFVPGFAPQHIIDGHVRRIQHELWLDTNFYFEHRASFAKGSKEAEEAEYEIKVSELMWKVIHAMFGVECELSLEAALKGETVPFYPHRHAHAQLHPEIEVGLGPVTHSKTGCEHGADVAYDTCTEGGSEYSWGTAMEEMENGGDDDSEPGTTWEDSITGE